jgi:hypothetical protein
VNKSTKDIGLELEQLVVAYFLEVDPSVRLSRASGATLDPADVMSRDFVLECKKRGTESLTIEKKVFRKLCNRIAIGSQKIPLLVMQNKDKDTYVICDIKDFMRILKEK